MACGSSHTVCAVQFQEGTSLWLQWHFSCVSLEPHGLLCCSQFVRVVVPLSSCVDCSAVLVQAVVANHSSRVVRGGSNRDVLSLCLLVRLLVLLCWSRVVHAAFIICWLLLFLMLCRVESLSYGVYSRSWCMICV